MDMFWQSVTKVFRYGLDMAEIILLVHDLKLGDILQVSNLLIEGDSEHKLLEMVDWEHMPWWIEV